MNAVLLRDNPPLNWKIIGHNGLRRRKNRGVPGHLRRTKRQNTCYWRLNFCVPANVVDVDQNAKNDGNSNDNDSKSQVRFRDQRTIERTAESRQNCHYLNPLGQSNEIDQNGEKNVPIETDSGLSLSEITFFSFFEVDSRPPNEMDY